MTLTATEFLRRFVGTGIPIHPQFHMDEAFYVLEGSGIFILSDVHHSFEKSGTIFIPKKSWHGFANPDHELPLLWVVTPAGLVGFSVIHTHHPVYRQNSSHDVVDHLKT